jgi:VanZ family protein
MEPQPFSWVPFKNSLSDSLEVNYSVLLEKCFWYFSLVWLLTRRGRGVAGAAFITAALLAAIEVAQLWLPGRSAEITDPLLAVIAGLLLAILGVHSDTTIRLPSHR